MTGLFKITDSFIQLEVQHIYQPSNTFPPEVKAFENARLQVPRSPSDQLPTFLATKV
jgi:hypothetical protein